MKHCFAARRPGALLSCASCALAAALLAGCAAVSPPDAAATVESGTLPAPAADAPPHGELHFVWQDGCVIAGDTVYETDSGYYYDARFLAGLDLNTGVRALVCAKPGCPHADAGCDAWIGPSPADGFTIAQCCAFAEDGRLYRVYVTAPEHGGGAARSTLTVSAPDGSGQTPLCEAFAPDASCLDIVWLADDDFLYAVYESNPPRADGLSSERTAVLRIGEADGGVGMLLHWSAGGETPTAAARVFAAAVCGSRLVMGQTHPPETHTGSMAGDAAATRTTWHVLDLETGALGDALPLADGGRLLELRGGAAWRIDESGTLTVLDPLTGETLRRCPGLWPAELEPCGIFAVTDRCIAIDGAERVPTPEGTFSDTPRRLVFDRASGALVRQLPATWMKDGAEARLPVLYAENGSRAALQVDIRLGTAADVGQDGSVYTHPASCPVYAVIGLEEYLNGSQDWTPCTPSDLGPVGPAAAR